MRPVIVAALFIVAAACGGDVRRSDPSTLEAAVHVETTGCGQATRLAGGSFIADRRVVTVAHVVAGTTGVVVVSSDGRRHPATVVGIDRHKDLALLAVDDATVDPLPIGSMAVGDVRRAPRLSRGPFPSRRVHGSTQGGHQDGQHR